MDLGWLWRLLLAAALVGAVTVWVVTVTVNLLPELPAGYVACNTTQGIGKAGDGCIGPHSSTPERNIVYCRATSEEDVETFDTCSNVKPGS